MTKFKKITIAALSIVLVAIVGIVLGVKLFKVEVKSNTYDRTLASAPEHTFNPITNPFPEDVICMSYTEFRQTIATNTATASYILAETKNKGKKIRIDTARELHHFSQDVSPNPELNYVHASTLMQLDYILGNDIDYSEVTGNTFIPIGYYYEYLDQLYQSKFTGTFDGRGFEIKNLYLADYDDLVLILDEVDIATTPYYAMFSFSSGTIKNFGLIDPQYELRTPHENITKAAHIVGENTGIVENVYVSHSQSNKGMIIRPVYGQTQSTYEAAGVVYHNKGNGTVQNVYYASDVVIDPLHIINFRVQPVIYKTDISSNVTNAIYDSSRYLLTITSGGNTYNVTPVNTPPNTGKTTTELKTNGMGANWFYYPNYRYPALFGLNKVSDDYIINNAVEFIYFNKLQRLNYIDTNGVNYRSGQYKLNSNIDMRIVSPSAYVTPLRSFDGIFNGNNKTIGYFTISKGTVANHEYFAGVFSQLQGQLFDLTMVEASINLADYEAPHFNHHVGILAGTISAGTVTNVSIQGNIVLNKKTPTTLSVGLLAGDACGTISNVYINGDITSHVIYAQSEVDNVTYNIGGIIGTTRGRTLKLENILHIGTIKTPTSNLAEAFSKNLVVYVGGVIGNVTNLTTTAHEFKLISHVGTITAENINTTQANFYIGGVIGDGNGVGFITCDRNRTWTHRGTIYNDISGVNTSTKTVDIAGVLNNGVTENTEFVELRNYDILVGSELVGFKDLKKNPALVYIPIINSRSTQGITLSQSSNNSRLFFDYNYPYHGIVKTAGASLLRFIENYGSVTFDGTGLPYNEALTFVGITRDTNINFLNVTQEADIIVKNLTNANTSSTHYSNIINVAGITTTLPSGKYIKNSYNKGNIIVANIQNQYSNIYIAGLVNHNYSGDLQSQGAALQPKATIGIINSVNYGNITSTFNSSTYGIQGRGNTYIGGLVTSNHGSIQDSINHGNLTMYNSVTNPTVDFETDDNLGGRIIKYQGGIIIGGIAAFIGSGDSRVYDTSNGGNIVGLSTAFVRVGGVVALALLKELEAGNAQVYGLSTIPDSIISNGINYGTVVGLTSTIQEYNPTIISGDYYDHRLHIGNNTAISLSSVPQTTEGTRDRLGVNSSAGGVIGYGLSEMRRMINHGLIVSTDVAGGVVGATFVYNSSGSYTYVKIDTAINYGDVRAYKKANYNNFDKINFSLTNLSTYLYATDDDFIVPTGVNRDEIRRYPRHKRGIGGVFGRLQRGRSQYMVGDGSSGSQFDFIVNMNPNVDLIGRLDQVYSFSSSLRFFRFGTSKYYSAKTNDTTQGAFTGYSYQEGSQSFPSYYYDTLYLDVITYSKIRYIEYNDAVTNKRYRVAQGYGTQITRRSTRNNRVTGRRTIYTAGDVRYSDGIVLYISGGTVYSQDNTVMWRNLTEPEEISSLNPNLENMYFPNINGETLGSSRSTFYYSGTGSIATSNLQYLNVKDVPWITENPSEEIDDDYYLNYVYHPAFEMRNEGVILSNGQPITSYINFAENAVLGERFIGTRPNGMYVLSSSAGSVYGETLPINTRFSNLLKLNGSQPCNIDYDDISYREEIDLTTDQRYLKYKNLFQVDLNDKSALLEQNQNLALRDNAAGIELVAPIIDHTNKEITFTFNMALVGVNQTELDLAVIRAHLPFRAFIAEPYSAVKYPDANAFIDALRNERQQNPGRAASQIYPPELSIDFTQYPAVFTLLGTNKYDLIPANQTIEIGTFRSYSEAALATTALMEQAFTYTDYKVFIDFRRASAINIRPTSYRVDNGGTTNISAPVPNTFVVPTQVTNTILVNHRDTSNPRVLNNGADISEYIKVYYQNTSTIVDPEYYTLVTTPVATDGTFSMTITLDERLRGGTYLIGYKYFNSYDEKYFQITKASNTNNNILTLHQRGLDPILNPAQSFTSTVPFLYSITQADVAFAEHTIPDVPAYVSNKYYTVGLLNNLEISPFATLTNVSLQTNYTPGGVETGYIQYVITYVVTSESGVAKTYTHTINENEVTLRARYINGAITYDPSLVAPREADETTFEFLYDVETAYEDIFYNLNNLDDVYIEITGPAGFDTSKYSADNVVSIKLTQEELPGDYVFNIVLKRKTDTSSYITLDLSTQTITKALGVSSYLTSIAFGEPGTELSYPGIEILLSTSTTPLLYDAYNQNPEFENYDHSYETFVYYAGIDYDNADVNKEQHIRIIGEVDNVNLNDFLPRMVEFLPIGAKIQKLVYGSGGTITYTTAVDASSSDSEIAELSADFTVYPTDGTEPDSDSDTDVIITYVVTSEDGLSKTYYYVSVVDAMFNITFIFDIFYKNAQGDLTNVNYLEAFYAFPIRVQLAVMETGLPIYEVLPEVPQFPTFTQINKFDNQISIYYQPLPTGVYGNYIFRFARNSAGFYQIVIDIPKRYTYEMYYRDNELADVSDYVAGYEGKYFYINSGIRNRTRRIKVVIEDNPNTPGWGLTDSSATYHD